MNASDVPGVMPPSDMLRDVARHTDPTDILKLEPMEQDNMQDGCQAADSVDESLKLKVEEEEFVYFARKTFLAAESAGLAEIMVLRHGPATGSCTVCVSTEEVKGSARMGLHFMPMKDREVRFEAGQRCKVLHIELMDDNRWDSTRLIGVVLTSPVGEACRVSIGTIQRCTVLVSKANRYPDGLPKGSPPLAQWQSMRRFLRNRAKDRRWKMVATVIALGYKGLYGVVDCFILKLVINNALGGYHKGSKNCTATDNDDEDGLRTSLTLAGIYVVALALHHVADRVQLDMRGRGSLRMWLREKLLGQYLHLSERGADGLAEGDLMNTMVCQVEELVEDGWHEALLLWESSVMIVTNIIFQIWLVAGKIPLTIILLVFAALLPVMLGSLACRERHLLHLNHAREHAEVDWMVCASELARARQLLQSYNAVNRAVRYFQQQYRKFYQSHKKSRFYQQSSEYIPKWALGLLLAGLYGAAPVLVEEYNISAGGLSSLVKSWLTLQKALLHFNESALCLQRSIGALEKISDVLNREDAVTMALIPQITKTGIQLNSVSRKTTLTPLDFPFDRDTIVLENVFFSYGQPRASDIFGKAGNTQDKVVHGPMLLRDVTAEIPCSAGGVMLICAPKKLPGQEQAGGVGRRTLLRLFAGMVYPLAGMVMLPPTRRWAFVDRTPQILKASLFRNLRIGRKQAWEEGEKEKICARGLHEDATVKDADALEELFKAIAVACGVREHLLWDLHVPIGGPGLDLLSTRDAVGICIARAFLAHPDILFVDHLGDGLGPEFVEATLLPLFLQYASGGLRAVLLGAGRADLAHSRPEPSPLPVVIWSSLVLSEKAAESAKCLLQLDGEGGVRVLS